MSTLIPSCHRPTALLLTGFLGAGLASIAFARRSPPRAVPRAPVVLQLGDVVSINGLSFRVTYGLTPDGGTPIPTPTPAPIGVTITGIRSPATGLLVTTATAGEPLILEGSGFGTTGRLQLGGRFVADVTAWTDTRVAFVAPSPGSGPVTGGWDLYQLGPGGFVLKASTGAFTLQPGAVPIPVPGDTSMTVTGFRGASGAPQSLFAPGTTIFVQGRGFGYTPGTLKVDHRLTPALTWTDGEITLRCPSLGTGGAPHAVDLGIVSADGSQWESLMAFTIQPAPASVERWR